MGWPIRCNRDIQCFDSDDVVFKDRVARRDFTRLSLSVNLGVCARRATQLPEYTPNGRKRLEKFLSGPQFFSLPGSSFKSLA